LAIAGSRPLLGSPGRGGAYPGGCDRGGVQEFSPSSGNTVQSGVRSAEAIRARGAAVFRSSRMLLSGDRGGFERKRDCDLHARDNSDHASASQEDRKTTPVAGRGRIARPQTTYPRTPYGL